MTIFLKSGEKGFIAGQTGSGKTQGAIFLLRHSAGFPKIILDSKIEDEFFKLPEGDEKLEVVESFAALERLAKLSAKHWPDYILVRPEPSDLSDSAAMDRYPALIYERFGRCLCYVDEVFSFQEGGRIGAGFLGLITRGRSRGKTLLMGAQRPAWISRFCLTESKKFYIYRLIDRRDHKTFSEIVPGFAKMGNPPEFHFWFYDTATDAPQLSAPVPFEPLQRSTIKTGKWL